MIIFDALGIQLIREQKLKNLNYLYMNRNSHILTCSTYPHTCTSNIMIWSGQHRNFFWVKNHSNKWIDPAGEYNRDKNIVENPEVKIITLADLNDITWIWEILQYNKIRARAVQLPIILPPISYNAPLTTKYWFPHDEKGLYNNMRDKEKITMNSLKEIAEDKIDFYCISMPYPDKLLHGIPEGYISNEFFIKELKYLDKYAKKIDEYCNNHEITYCIFGDHGLCHPPGENFSYIIDQKIAAVRHRKHSIIISNYDGETPDYTDEIFPWMLKFYNIEKTNIEKKNKIELSQDEETLIKRKLKKIGYL